MINDIVLRDINNSQLASRFNESGRLGLALAVKPRLCQASINKHGEIRALLLTPQQLVH